MKVGKIGVNEKFSPDKMYLLTPFLGIICLVLLLSLDLDQTEQVSLLVTDKKKRGTQGGQFTTTLLFINKVNESCCSYVSIFSNLNWSKKTN